MARGVRYALDIGLDHDVELDPPRTGQDLLALARAVAGGLERPGVARSDAEWLATVLRELRDQGVTVTAVDSPHDFENGA